MKKLVIFLLLTTFLSGCFFRVHKRDIEQGNIITEEAISRLKIGMSSDSVKKVMGNPVLVNIFTPNRIEYVYTFQKGYEAMLSKRVSCVFAYDRLQEVIVS